MAQFVVPVVLVVVVGGGGAPPCFLVKLTKYFYVTKGIRFASVQANF